MIDVEASMTDQPVQLLWTGGWDSSFRLMQLLLVEQRPVQPIYVVNLTRRSLRQELQTMTAMRRELSSRTADPWLMLPTQLVLLGEFPVRSDLTALEGRIREQAWIGSQYSMLARVGEALGWQDVELCMEAFEGGASDLQRLLFRPEGGLSDAPAAALFRCWSFPVLHLTKAQMGEVAREHGFYDLLLRRWFCHDPVVGRPCGRCRPCQLANREGVEFASPALVAAIRARRTAARRARKLLRRR